MGAKIISFPRRTKASRCPVLLRLCAALDGAAIRANALGGGVVRVEHLASGRCAWVKGGAAQWRVFNAEGELVASGPAATIIQIVRNGLLHGHGTPGPRDETRALGLSGLRADTSIERTATASAPEEDPRPGKGIMKIGIIGGGFSGCMLAVHLLRRARAPLDIVLFERSGQPGRGVAYSAQNPHHLLNVRVANMSAFDDDPSHFLRWLWAKDWSESPAASIPPSGHAFVSRGVYGAYISDVLDEAIESVDGTASLEIVPNAVSRVTPLDRGLRADVEGIGAMDFDRVVLCVGNFPPAFRGSLPANIAGDPRFIANPWDPVAFGRIAPDDTVLVVGSGLTMVDVAILLDESGHRGTVHAISRRGLVPVQHEQTRRYPLFLDPDDLPRSVTALMRSIRAEVKRAAAGGYDWRSVIDALRPVTQALWVNLPPAARLRFIRHARPYWDIHRHRVAPAIGERVAALRAEGRLAFHGGRIEAIEETGGGRLSVTFRLRGTDERTTLDVDRIVNCSGPETDFSRLGDPLVHDLLERGTVRPDACRLGLDVDPACAVIDAEGSAGSGLFALGPPTRAAFWEIIAVPDIRRQAEALATRLLASVEHQAVRRPD